MLKRTVHGQTWLVTQPDHAAVSGYLAAHWGNRDFTKPGFFGKAPQPEALAAETVFGIAEHDNGWWEWEADPDLDSRDRLPLHLTDLTQEQGMERWRLGVPRFQQHHPFAALLISLHAYWLYTYRVEDGLDPAFRHPLFGSPNMDAGLEGEELDQARRFVAEQKQVQNELIARLRQDPHWTATVEPEILSPHSRLLQLGDALSLALCFGGDQELQLPEIPRQSWNDRVTLELTPRPGHHIVCKPYPFDTDPLPVSLRARILDVGAAPKGAFQSWWHGIPRQQIRFEYRSA